jgi:hypothetical protein
MEKSTTAVNPGISAVVFDHAPIGMALSSAGSLTILKVNQKLKADLGRSSVGSWSELLHPDDAATARRVLLATTASELHKVNCRLIRGDHTILWVCIKHIPVQGDGQEFGIVFVQALHHRNIAAAILANNQAEGMQRVHALLQDLVEVRHLLRLPSSPQDAEVRLSSGKHYR